MSAVPWPDHLLSLDEWDALPEDTTHRYELAEGALQVSPRPALKHQMAITELAYHLRVQLPDDLRPVTEAEVLLFGPNPATVRIPDVLVVPRHLAESDATRCDSADVVLAVEVISPGSARMDRVTKHFEYAEAGIAYYWIVDLDKPATITAYQLIDGDYELLAEATDRLLLDSPTPLDIDITQLTG